MQAYIRHSAMRGVGVPSHIYDIRFLKVKRCFLISDVSTDSMSWGTCCLQASCRLSGSALCILCISYFSHMIHASQHSRFHCSKNTIMKFFVTHPYLILLKSNYCHQHFLFRCFYYIFVTLFKQKIRKQGSIRLYLE